MFGNIARPELFLRVKMDKGSVVQNILRYFAKQPCVIGKIFGPCHDIREVIPSIVTGPSQSKSIPECLSNRGKGESGSVVVDSSAQTKAKYDTPQFLQVGR